MRSSLNNKLSEGFTIVELLIAMTGFSFILLLVTIVMINIGNIYSKGINQTRLDDAVRYISSDLSRQFKYNKVSNFSSSPEDATEDIKAYCIGSTKYTYITGYKIGDKYKSRVLQHVMLKTSIQEGESECSPEDLYSNASRGEELIPKNSSISFFEVINTGYQYTIKVALAYGDKTAMQNYGYVDVKCDSANQYYCAVSSLTTVVSARLN